MVIRLLPKMKVGGGSWEYRSRCVFPLPFQVWLHGRLVPCGRLSGVGFVFFLGYWDDLPSTAASVTVSFSIGTNFKNLFSSLLNREEGPYLKVV